jgi:hypothetical protein
MGQLVWNGDAFYEHIQTRAAGAMADALPEGVSAAAAQSRVDTGRYRDGWKAEPVSIDGDVVHGEIVNDAENTSGQFYSAYVSAGTSKMSGDFAHIAALDRAGAALMSKLGGVV